MTTLQKISITAALIAAAGAGIFEAHQIARLHDQNQSLQQELAPLADEVKNLQKQFAESTNKAAGLLAENSRLKSTRVESELLKLRGQTGMLHRQNNELIQALQDAEKQNHPAFPTNYVAKESWGFAGYDTPENSLKSTIWAKSAGNEQAFLAGSAPEDTNSFSGEIQGDTDDERSHSLMDAMKNVTGYQILSETPAANGEVLIQLEAQAQVNGTTISADSIEVMKQINGQWKLYDQYNNADQIDALLRSLNNNSTGANPADNNPAGTIRVIGQ